MPLPLRNHRFPAERLKQLLTSRPFDAALWDASLGNHPHLRIGNDAAITGKAIVLERLAALLARIDGIGSGFCEVWQRHETIFAETEITYLDASGRSRAIPCAIIARSTHGVMHDLRFYLDPTPIIGWPATG